MYYESKFSEGEDQNDWQREPFKENQPQEQKTEEIILNFYIF
jgi:hypothetical protein